MALLGFRAVFNMVHEMIYLYPFKIKYIENNPYFTKIKLPYSQKLTFFNYKMKQLKTAGALSISKLKQNRFKNFIIKKIKLFWVKSQEWSLKKQDA